MVFAARILGFREPCAGKCRGGERTSISMIAQIVKALFVRGVSPSIPTDQETVSPTYHGILCRPQSEWGCCPGLLSGSSSLSFSYVFWLNMPNGSLTENPDPFLILLTSKIRVTLDPFSSLSSKVLYSKPRILAFTRIHLCSWCAPLLSGIKCDPTFQLF